MYQVPITVYQAESPPVVVGEEYSHSHASLTLYQAESPPVVVGEEYSHSHASLTLS